MNPPLTEAVLGIACDRGAWPEAANAGEAACGTPVLGPIGLLRVIETALGLGGPEAPMATRLAAWRAKLEAAGAGRFWDESFAQDPLATAESLLAWRDGLVEAGWQAATTPGLPRLRDLADAELAGPALPAGYPDRLAAALAELTSAAPRTLVARLRLLDAREHLPPSLARLVAALEARGTLVATEAEPFSPALGDLGAAQDALRMGAGAQLTGDGRFALLTAETETAAAEALADWLAVGGAAGSTAIISDRSTAALDAALARRGLPALGVSRASPQRGVLQLLPLALATRWRPFDAVRMLQLLQARPSPLPREIRHVLANALVAAPGRGGPDWGAALTDGKAAFAARLTTEEADTPTRKAAPRLTRALARVAALVEAPLEDPIAGMPVETLRALCGLLAAWATEQGRGEDPLFTALAGAARTLAEAALASGRSNMPRVELERLVGVALENGVPDPAVAEEAAPWFLLRDPAGLWDYVDTVVWWGLGQPSLPARRPWSRAESLALAGVGVALPEPATALAALSAGWRRPLLFARQRALLVAVPEPGAADARRHPLLDELREMLAGAPSAVKPQAEPLLGDPAAKLMGTKLARVPLASAALPQARADWTIPANAVSIRPVESASSLERLLGCAYGWVGHYAARLRPGRAAEVPQGAQLVGLLAHKLAQEIFTPGTPPAPGAARAAAEARLPGLLDEMAAPLLAPGAAGELARLRTDLPRAMEALALLIAKHGLTITGTEVERETKAALGTGQDIAGTIDLLLARPDGRAAVLDMKWAGTDRYRRAEVLEGRAVQLAAYVGLVGAGEDAGFFMLAQCRVLATDASLFGGRPAPGLPDTWQRTLLARQARLATIGAGTLHAIGIGWDDRKKPDDPDAAAVRTNPPCRYCALPRLCGKEAMR
jgi:ATP-dependent helicase/nuclease subunit B